MWGNPLLHGLPREWGADLAPRPGSVALQLSKIRLMELLPFPRCKTRSFPPVQGPLEAQH